MNQEELYLYNEGRWLQSYEKMGAHIGPQAVEFCVWAPNASYVSVVGEFNSWNREAHPMEAVGASGLWKATVAHAEKGQVYKYFIRGQNGYEVEKADPFAVWNEVPPRTGSVVWDLNYDWKDEKWLQGRSAGQSQDAPISVYEVHLGSWMRKPGREWHSYREMAEYLPQYVKEQGFTHVELLPVMEHPFYGSWGYQTTGYFAPTSRYGTPQEFMELVDRFHQEGIGVILDWVPSHFPSDEHGLGYFDGTHLFEHEDPKQGFHPDWNSLIFNYGRNEVRGFLLSSAMFWLDKYHIDGLRVDAVASMLYLDYSRQEGQWIANRYGGRENLEAIDFLKQLNEAIYSHFPGAQTFAEESTAWPKVSRPTYEDGLGFGYKWDMGWMHDTLSYFSKDPLYRTYHQNELTFRMVYAFNENFVLSISHDEVVHGKGSLFDKMPGDDWQKFANLRLLYAYMYAQPGKKLIFMGQEFAQKKEWSHEEELDWGLLADSRHSQVQVMLKDLNTIYSRETALFQLDHQPEGFEWADAADDKNSIISFFRKDANGEVILCIFNFTPVPRSDYRLGVPLSGYWQEILNTDAHVYGGAGVGNLGQVKAEGLSSHGQDFSLCLQLPPLAALYLKWKGDHD